MKKPRQMFPAKPNGRRRPGRGVLIVIAALLFTSGLLHLGEGAGSALALDLQEAKFSQECGCAPEVDAMALLDELRSREQRLLEREGQLADRVQALRLVEDRVEQRLAALVEAENELARTVAIADRAAEEDISRLVTLYENMKPKEASRLFQEMAPEFAAGFLSRMRPEAAAAILAGIEPKIGYTISAIIASRNANAPKN